MSKSRFSQPLSTNEDVGIAKKYLPNPDGAVEDWSERFIVFYPLTSSAGSVSFVLNHPNIPIKIKSGDTQLKVILDKGESVLVEPYVDRGELSAISVSIEGTAEYTMFTYDKE